MIRESIKDLYEGKDLTSEGMRKSMEEIMTGEAAPSQIGAFLSLLAVKTPTVNEITQAARVMREKASSIEVDGELLDTCSTGGTGINHMNISTTVAFIIAGAGMKVAKHGNRAATGKCGSADVLEKLGVNIELKPEEVKECIEKTGIGFLYARTFHQAMKYAAGARKEIGIRTVFNLLGPLTNPASVDYQLLGVYAPELTDSMAAVLGNLGVKRAMVVHGHGGLDEISLSGTTKVSELKDDFVKTYEISPDDFGLKTSSIEDIKGGDEEINASITRKVLAGEKGAFRDICLANASAALVVAGLSEDFKEGVKMAEKIIDTGSAALKLDKLIEMSQSFG
ncbi:MAG: anthranilate phosphoribosyltransferase [Elusimicrobiota bacterium]